MSRSPRIPEKTLDGTPLSNYSRIELLNRIESLESRVDALKRANETLSNLAAPAHTAEYLRDLIAAHEHHGETL